MAQTETPPETITMSNTKKEMLAAYNDLVKQLEQKRKADLKPEQKIEEKRKKESVAAADSLSTEGIGKGIGNLRSEIGNMLVQLSDKLEEEISRYRQVKTAVEAQEAELQEIFEIQKSASSLAALLEAQAQKRDQFETEMAEKKQQLEQEIQSTREAWKREKEIHDAEVKERAEAEKKARTREAEEHEYAFAREKQRTQEQFEYEKAKLEREVAEKKEEMERDLKIRSQALAEKEAELQDLRARVEAFPKELDAAVKKAVAETADRLTREAQNREALLQKDAQGEQNVLTSRIQALERTVEEQAAHIAKLSGQLEKSYTQVQDIAVKAIEGSWNTRAFAAAQAQAAKARESSAEEK